MIETRPSSLPPFARSLGYAGLVPQVAAFVMVLDGDPRWRFTALALGYAYAALILSFLGGLWWGLAAAARLPVSSWIWGVAVAPSLIALVSAIPWSMGEPWPGPSLGLLGTTLLGSLIVDHRLVATQVSPAWWMRLRVPLSVGLGGLTLAICALA